MSPTHYLEKRYKKAVLFQLSKFKKEGYSIQALTYTCFR
uniref:Uncharacterized protein n=1 Tax=Arundo donax TaxID=35708 RepID=A0A0A9HA26_ARUDO